jgi:hypothetical protein
MNNDAVLMDKSRIALDLFTESYWPFFLSRPNRVGKSLLLDTIKPMDAIKPIVSGNNGFLKILQ